MQLSYNIIKGNSVNANTVYAIKTPIIPVKIREKQVEEEIVIDTIDTSVEDARAYAESLVDEGLKKSQDIINSALAEAERIKKEAFDTSVKKGYSEGYKKGNEDGLKSVENLKVQAENILKDAHRVSREYIEAQRDEILGLSLHIAKMIIGYEADANDCVVAKTVNDAIKAAVVKEQVIIRVNPMDYALIDCRRDEFSKSAGENLIINIIRDDSIGRGGCRLETEGSYVDADLDSQFEKIKVALMGT